MQCPVQHSTSSDWMERVKDKTPEEQQQYMWNILTESEISVAAEWPSFQDVYNDVTETDPNILFHNKNDVRDSNKLLCANGILCQVRIEWFNGHGYTGLFERADYGILRLSSALPPLQQHVPSFAGGLSESKLFPCVALKFFRRNAHSGNMLFGGKKTGQKEDFFFERSVCTNLTEKVNFFLSWILRLFRRYSEYPTQLGVSDFASVHQDGTLVPSDEVNFPWCVALYPVISEQTFPCLRKSEQANNESYLEHLLEIEEGTTLYDVYALPTPEAALDLSGTSIQRIGRVVTASKCIRSAHDRRIVFRHQRKEEDYERRPYWMHNMVAAHTEVGAGFFDKMIPLLNFYDFENQKGDNIEEK